MAYHASAQPLIVALELEPGLKVARVHSKTENLRELRDRQERALKFLSESS
jgi:hypothetical protein